MRRLFASLCIAAIAAGTAAAQPALQTKATTAAEKMATAIQHIVRIPNDRRMLVATETEAWLIDPNDLKIERRHTIDGVEPSHRTGDQLDSIVLWRASADGRTALDPVSGEPRLSVARDADVLAARVGPRDGLLVTAEDEQKRVIVRRPGDSAPVVTLNEPTDRLNQSVPRASLSENGRLLLVTWGGRARLIDLVNGMVRLVPRAVGESAVAFATFSSDDTALVLLPERGPLDVRSTSTLEASGRIAMPDVVRRYYATAHRGGRVLEIEGRGQRVVFDAKTGKSLAATRLSSGSGFLLRFVEPDLVLRAAAPPRGKGASYGVYRHVKGDFKLLFRDKVDGVKISALVTSPNAACLLVVAASGAKIVAAATNATLATVTDAPAVGIAAFAADGSAVIAGTDGGEIMRVAAPAVCRRSTVAR